MPELDAHLADPGHDAHPQRVGGAVVTAAAGDEHLDLLLDAELPQAGRALVEVLADLVLGVVVDLAVEEGVDRVEDLAAVGVVRVCRSS